MLLHAFERPIDALYERGARYVIATANKRPIMRGWLDGPRPSAGAALDCLARPDQLLGIVPASVGATVADIDDGAPEDVAALAARWPPLAVLRSRRPGGQHVWWRDTTARPNGRWHWRTLAGDVRSARGYVVIWPPDGWAVLADALTAGSQGDLFPDRALAPWNRAPALAGTLADGERRTGRHWTLYRAGLEHARRQSEPPRPDAMRAYLAAVNARLERPIGPARGRELDRMARDIAAAWPAARAAYSKRQRDRQTRAVDKRRRNSLADMRDSEIRRRLADGEGVRAVARAMGVSAGTVCYVRDRDG